MRRRAPFAIGAGRAPLLLLALASLGACRDTIEPFRPVDRVPPTGSPLRLTFSPGQDRMPEWSDDGDTIYFTAGDLEENVAPPGILVGIPVDASGPVQPLLTNAQVGIYSQAWLTASAIAPDRRRVAFLRVPPQLAVGPCVGTRVCPNFEHVEHLPMVRLTSAELHVRQIDAVSGLQEDEILQLGFSGHQRVPDETSQTGFLVLSDYHPFQLEWEERRRAFFRPSWHPDGTRLVSSDGLHLFVWTVASGVVTPIPGTDDGIVPAWSPDGQWIAYARYARTSSETIMCEYQNQYDDFLVTDCYEERTMHYAGEPVIVLVRPDGSEQRVLGAGTDPAWSPDGQHIYASVGNGIDQHVVRMAIDGTPAAPVAGTEQGVEPAVSPDGRRLAFARAIVLPNGLLGQRDIWVVDLP